MQSVLRATRWPAARQAGQERAHHATSLELALVVLLLRADRLKQQTAAQKAACDQLQSSVRALEGKISEARNKKVCKQSCLCVCFCGRSTSCSVGAQAGHEDASTLHLQRAHRRRSRRGRPAPRAAWPSTR